MSRPQLKHRHHTAPKVYLRGFADDDGVLLVRRRGGDEFEQHINNVAVRNGFYNVRGPDGRMHDAVEDWFMTDIETPVGPALTALRDSHKAGPIVDDTTVLVLGNFVAAQLLRTATVRSYLSQIDGHIGPEIAIQTVMESIGMDASRLSAQQRSQHLRAAGDMLRRHQHPDEIHLSHIRTTLREIDRTMTRLSSFRWELVEAPAECLITSDAPAVGLRASPNAFHGVLPSWSPVLVPISPRRLVVGSPKLTGLRGRLTEPLALLTNRRVAYEADDAVIRARGQAWPTAVSVGSRRPQLPPPRIRKRPAFGGAQSAPVRYRPVSSRSIGTLLAQLGAEDRVL